MMKKGIALLIIVAGLSGVVTAQPFNIDLSFAMGTPKGSFSNALDRNLYGIDMALTYQLQGTPLHFGMGLQYQNFGWSESYDYYSFDGKVRTTHDMISPHLLMRIEAPLSYISIVSPFVEGIVGFNYLYTESKVVDFWSDEETPGTINYDHATPSYGIGGGLRIRLFEEFDFDGDYLKIAFLIKTRYMVGGEAVYLKEGGLTSTSSGLNYNLERSRTDLVTLNFGFVLSF